MADVKTEQEPSIEEILESIRQIISEDGEAPAQAGVMEIAIETPAPPPPPPPKPAAPAPQADKPNNVLDLTEKVVVDRPSYEYKAPAEDKYAGDLDLSQSDDGLLSDMATDASAAAMAKLLAGNMAVEREVTGRVGNVTLEDIARELMRPVIKSWLDQNLPRIIEKMVAKEIEKVSRMAMRQ